MTRLDEAIEDAGGFGICQILFLVSTTVFTSLVGANMGASIFEAFMPPTQCKSPFESELKELCPDSFRELLVPRQEDGKLSFCYRYNFTSGLPNKTESDSHNKSCQFQFNNSDTETIRCDDWSYDDSVMTRTIITEFNLVCGSQWGAYLSQSALMLGVGVGNVLTGYISDRYGRRRGLLIVSIAITVSGGLLSITKSYIAYSFMRAVLGLFVYSPFLILFVHALELTVPRYRSVVAQVLELSFPFGFAFLSWVSYSLRDWRNIQLAISLPSIAGLIIWWASPESPRWLMMMQRESDASSVIARIARINRSKQLSTDQRKILSIEIASENESNSFKLMFKTPSIRSASLRMFYNWFAVSCVYYGLTLNAGELSGDPFSNLLINAAAEAVAVLLTIPLVNILGRRITGGASEILAGLLCVLVQFVSHTTASKALAIFGKFAISISFSTMFITASEIYPTEIRNFATGLCSAMARLGGVVSPLISMTSMTSKELPYVIFGVLAFLAGLVILTLPETKGVPLPQTIADGVQFLDNNRMSCSSKIPKSLRTWHKAESDNMASKE